MAATQKPKELMAEEVVEPVGNDNRIVELAAAVLTQSSASPVGDDGVGAVQLVEMQVAGCGGPRY